MECKSLTERHIYDVMCVMMVNLGIDEKSALVLAKSEFKRAFDLMGDCFNNPSPER